jgi:hypothetical protein
MGFLPLPGVGFQDIVGWFHLHPFAQSHLAADPSSICPKPTGKLIPFSYIFVDSGDYQSKIIEGPEMQKRFFPHFTFGNIQGARWVCPIQNGWSLNQGWTQ